jgi:hypothetical protein
MPKWFNEHPSGGQFSEHGELPADQYAPACLAPQVTDWLFATLFAATMMATPPEILGRRKSEPRFACPRLV